MKRVMIGSAVVAALALAGCGSQTVTTAGPTSPSPSPSSAVIVAYDQIDVAKWHDDMVAAGARQNVNMQAVYTLTTRLCGEDGRRLALDLATRIENTDSERVAFKYVCPTRVKVYDGASQVAD